MSAIRKSKKENEYLDLLAESLQWKGGWGKKRVPLVIQPLKTYLFKQDDAVRWMKNPLKRVTGGCGAGSGRDDWNLDGVM